MTLRIIADAGSSKTDWSLTDGTGTGTKRFATPGLNALLAEVHEVEASLRGVAEHLPEGSDVMEINYYGAGCATPAICSKMRSALSAALRCGNVNVESDLLGAARSLLGRERGIACILGTGSNSCLYDGKEIVENIPSMGYILGDEGSGAALGKRLVADAFKRRLPEAVTEDFLREFDLDLAEILTRVYRTPAPNKFLASLAPFIHRNLGNPYIYAMVRDEFRNFFVRNVSAYAGARKLPVSFTGSVAFHFADVIREAGEELGIKVGKIAAQPLEGLIRYHNL